METQHQAEPRPGGRVSLRFADDRLLIRRGGREAGSVRFSIHPLHARNLYLEPQITGLDEAEADAAARALAARFHRPLQVMLSAGEERTIALLRSAGFRLRRSCFLIQAGPEDFPGNPPPRPRPLRFARKGEARYEACCRIMLRRYEETHRDISPWTGSMADFQADLPDLAAYEETAGDIVNLAFVTREEIAYVYGAALPDFLPFAGALAAWMFRSASRLFFEADDTDPFAMALAGLFSVCPRDTVQTYVLRPEELSAPPCHRDVSRETSPDE